MTVRCVNPDCGRKKMFPSEGSYLSGGRWFFSWRCKTAVAPDEQIYRTKLESMKVTEQ